MKRRGFFGAMLGIAAAPVAASLPSPKPAVAYDEPIVGAAVPLGSYWVSACASVNPHLRPFMSACGGNDDLLARLERDDEEYSDD